MFFILRTAWKGVQPERQKADKTVRVLLPVGSTCNESWKPQGFPFSVWLALRSTRTRRLQITRGCLHCGEDPTLHVMHIPNHTSVVEPWKETCCFIYFRSYSWKKDSPSVVNRFSGVFLVPFHHTGHGAFLMEQCSHQRKSDAWWQIRASGFQWEKIRQSAEGQKMSFS